MKNKVNRIIEDLKNAILQEEILGINQFVEFVEQNAKSSDLIDDAVIKKMAFLFTNDSDKKKTLIKEMFDIIDKTELEIDENIQQKDEFQIKIEQVQKHITDEFSKNYAKNVVISCKHISKEFKGRFGFKLSNISMKLKLGEITAIFGENASGKTTLIKQLIGELLPDEGKITYPYFNQKITHQINWNSIKYEIAYVPQELNEWYGNLRENLHLEAARHGIVGRDNEREVEFIIHRLGLDKYCDRAWKELSGGFKLRFALAKALVWKPKVLILDEPLANLDPKAQLIVLNDLRAFSRSVKNPLAILLTSQTLNETEYIADKIMFIKGNDQNKSKVVFYGKKSELEGDRKHNKFTIEGDFTVIKLENLLYNLKPIDIKHTGLEYVLTMPLNVQSSDIISTLSPFKLEMKSFANISQSIKSKFI